MPSIDFLQEPDYRLVPGVGIGSRGPVASVALFTRVPIEKIQSIALDTSSRTSVTLIRVLCKHRFAIAPEFVAHGPDLKSMVMAADASLLIGDPAFEADPLALGLRKIDLGEEWTAMTGLPFIYAAWTGRSGAVTSADVEVESERPTGVFFDAQTPEAIAGAVRTFERHRSRIASDACRENAQRFSAPRFRSEFSAFVGSKWDAFRRNAARP